MTAQRRDERVKINREFDSFDQFINEYVSNISASGAFIRTRAPLPVGTLVDLRFTVIMREVEVIEGVGEVVRIDTSPPGMGIVFRELTAESQSLLTRLLDQRGMQVRAGGSSAPPGRPSRTVS